jgi:hypothetical protein
MSNSKFSIARTIKQIYFSEMRINSLNTVLNDVVKKYLKMNASDDIMHFRKKIDDYYRSIKYIKRKLLNNYDSNNMLMNSNDNIIHLINDGNINLETIDKRVDKLSRELQVYLINKV